MSQTIEERVVRMDFDNQRFEQNVKESLGTIEKLDNALEFDGIKNGVKNINDGFTGLNTTGLSAAIDTVSEKFDALHVIAARALQNITDAAMRTGKQLVESFTIEPVRDGFAEYELKMGSVQTIMASTGASLEEVNGYLSELNTYADKTIYSFSDMTSSIGKFTNAGVDLDSAVKAIQGISNEAAVSGANANEASHAMYNFAQALSAGSVKLIDWKSIENANMATQEFKQQLIDTAVEVGTLTKKGDEYISTTTDMNGHVSEAFTATKMFNDSLSSQWMTTDVLIKTLGEYADETTDIGKKAFASAQDVKTFSQLMDTLKEAVGSGWSETFELIIGDFNEAKKLWTGVSQVLGKIIDDNAQARKNMLLEWRSAGGYESAINAIRNAYNSLLSILKPIKEAFRDVFPAMSGTRLAEITKGIEEFTKKIKLNEEQMSNLHDTFRGIFSVFDILGRAVGGIITAITPVGNVLTTIIDLLLSFTSAVGRSIAGVDELVKSTGIFNTIGNVIAGVLNTLSNGISYIKDFIKDLVSIIDSLLSGTLKNFIKRILSIDSALSFLKKNIKGFSKFLTDEFGKIAPPVESFSDKIQSTIDKVFDKLKSVSKVVGNVLKEISKGISNFFSNTSFNTLVDIANGGIMIAIAQGLKKMIKAVSDVKSDGLLGFITNINALKDIGGSIKNVMKSASDAFAQFQKSVELKSLKEIALAIGVLTVSLMLLSTIDSKKLAASLTAMGVMMGELSGTLAVINKIDKLKSLTKTAVGMVGVSIAVLILAGALKKLSGIDTKSMVRGLVAIQVVLADLVAVSVIMSKTKTKMVKGSLGLIVFAVAINIFADAVKKLGKLDVDTLIKGLAGVGGLLLEISIFSKLAQPKQIISTGLGMMAIAQSMKMFADAIKAIGKIETETIGTGLKTIGILLTEISIFSKLVDPKRMISTGVSMVIIAQAMDTFAGVIKKIGKIKTEDVGKGIITIGILLTEISIFTRLVKPNSLFVTSASMLVLAEALKQFTAVISSFKDIEPETITKGLATLGIALLEIGGFSRLVKPTNLLASSFAMVFMSGAINTLTGSLETLGKMSVAAIAKSLISLGGALLILAVGANKMTTALPGAVAMVVLASAITLLVPALKALGNMKLSEIGTAILGIAATLAVLGLASSALEPAIVPMLGMAAALISLGVAAVAIGGGLSLISIGISSLAVAITTLANTSAKDIKKFISNFEKIFEEALKFTPKLASVLVIAIESFLKTLAAKTPSILKSVGVILKGVLALIRNLIPDVVALVVTLINNVLDSIQSVFPNVIDTIITLVHELLRAVTTIFPEVVDTGMTLIIQLLNGIANKIDGVVTAGVNLVVQFLNGIAKNIDPVIEAGINLIASIIIGIIHAVPDIFDKGSDIVDELIKGVKSILSNLLETGASLISEVKKGIEGAISKIRDVGKNVVDGFVKGIKSAPQKVVNAAKELASSALSAAKKALGVESPSKEFKIIGKFVIDGFDIGLRKNAKKVVKTTEGIVNEVAKAARYYDYTNALKLFSKKDYKDLQDIFMSVADIKKLYRSDMSDKDFKNILKPFTKSALNNAVKVYDQFKSLLKNLDKDTKKLVLSIPQAARQYMLNMTDVTSYMSKSVDKFAKDYGDALKAVGVKNVKKVAAGAIQNLSTYLYMNSDEYKESLANLKTYGKELNKIEESNKKLLSEKRKEQSTVNKLQKKYNESKKEENKKKKEIAATDKVISENNKQIQVYKDRIAVLDREARTASDKRKAAIKLEKQGLNDNIYALNNSNKAAKEVLKTQKDQLKTIQSTKKERKKNLDDAKKDLKETKAAIKENGKETERVQKKVAAEAKKMRKDQEKAIKNFRKSIKETAKEFMSISNLATDKLISGFSAVTASTDLVVEATKNFDFLGVSFGTVTEAAATAAKATEKVAEGVDKITETFDIFNAKAETGIDLFTKFTKTGSAESAALLENADSALEAYDEFVSGLDQMRSKGFSDALLDQLEEQGPDALNYIRGFLSMSDDEIGKYNEKINKKAEYEANALSKSMQKQLDAYDKWVSDIEALAARGLSDGIINKLKDGGVNQASFVESLLAADDATLGRVDSIYADYVKRNTELSSSDVSNISENAEAAGEEVGETITTSFREALYKELEDEDTYDRKLDWLSYLGIDGRLISELKEKGYSQGTAIVDDILKDLGISDMAAKGTPASDGMSRYELGQYLEANAGLLKEYSKKTEDAMTQMTQATMAYDEAVWSGDEKNIENAKKTFDYYKQMYIEAWNQYDAEKTKQESYKKTFDLLGDSIDTVISKIGEYNSLYSASVTKGKSPAEKMAEDMETTLATKKNWDKNLKAIAKAYGKDSNIYKQIEELGYDAGAEYAEAFVKATPEQQARIAKDADKIAKANADAMIATYEKRGATVVKMGEQFAEISARTVDKKFADAKKAMLEDMATWGPEMADHMDAIFNMSDAQFERLVKDYKKGQGTWANSFADNMVAGLSLAMSGLTDNMKKAGVNSIQGFTEGLGDKESKKALKKKANKLADSVIKSVKDTLKIASPSGVTKEIGKYTIQGLTNGLKKYESASDMAVTAAKAIKKGFTTYLSESKGKTIATNYISGMEDGFDEVMPSIVSKVSSYADQIKSAVSVAESELAKAKTLAAQAASITASAKAVGTQVSKGVATGATSSSSVNAIKNAATQVANNLVNNLKSNLKIKSPSRVMRDEVGVYIGEGLADGISESGRFVEAESRNLVDEAVDGMREALQRAATIIEGSEEINPVITPDLDLTYVKKRANTLSAMLSAESIEFDATENDRNLQNGTTTQGMTFIQNNYSPKALDRLEIYRQTRNQFAQVKGALA